MMMDQQNLSEFLLRQQMLHAASLRGLHPSMIPSDAEPPSCEARLLNADLWRRFHELGTEMIITKGGRRMFPSLRVSLVNLDPNEEYCVLLELSLVGRRRLRWAGGNWAAAGGAEPQSARRVVLHPDSPATGAHWTSNPVSFGKVKLTNNTMDTQGHMVLTSMHKYRPRVIVVRARDAAALAWGAPHAAFSFQETEFIAVTAYQNDRITKLKIDNNPFAKGFRAYGQSKCKRKAVDVDTTSSNDGKRQCSDAASSCSDDGSMRSTSPERISPRSNQQTSSPDLTSSQRTPSPIEQVAKVTSTRIDIVSPEFLHGSTLQVRHPYAELPYMAQWPMFWSSPLWMSNFLPRPVPTTPPCKKVKSFTISSILGES